MAGTKWWGWGAEAKAVTLESRPFLFSYLATSIGLTADDRLAVPTAESIVIPPSRLSEADLAAFREILWNKGPSTSHMDRLAHAVGKSYRDLLRLRVGPTPTAPDAVLLPESEDQVTRILSRCTERRIAVVPFGGGTSVVGGVEVVEPSMPHVALDLRKMARVGDIDVVSHTATAEAGISGPALEEALAGKGLTLGHLPQSFEFSTLGGWIASRSAGAYSNRYGKIEDLVVGVRLVAPAGTFVLRSRPRHAMGSDLLGLVVGSEGTLGVITRATVRVHRAPETRRFEAYLFRGFGEGLDALRGMVQDAGAPHMGYLMDEDETRLAVAASGKAESFLAALLKTFRRVDLNVASLLLLGYEGTRGLVRSARAHGRRHCEGAVSVGPGPAESWSRERYETPYLRDSLLDHRVMVETVETAIAWSAVERLHDRVRAAILDAIRATGVPGIVGCHVSHVYTEGASLYFTWMARQVRGEELAQYDAVKAVATRAILDHGGLLSHHHGIGAEHAKYLPEAVGDPSVRLMRDVKARFDPAGIMNPGKVFPVSA